MSIWFIIGLVVLLYIRTLDYKYVIDDNVKRNGYMYEVPLMAPPVEFWDKRPPRLYRLFMIGMHCVNTYIIYLMFGWGPALIFAVHPLGVIGTAWVTGNYYATAAYFTLIAFYFLQTFHCWWAVLIAAPIYYCGLFSTVCPITFPFLFLFAGTPWGLAMFIPLGIFLKSKKFQTGIKIRLGINNETNVSSKFHFKRTALMTKMVARYIYNTLVPIRLGFFDGYGHRLRDKKEVYDKYCSYNLTFWACLAVCLSVFIAGLLIHPMGILWFFTFVMLHSQWNLTGQFFALRYLYLAMVGMCIVVGTLLQPFPVLMTIVATFLVIRTHFFIYTWRDQESMWRNDMETYPEYPQVYNAYAQHFLALSSPDPKKHQMLLKNWKINEIGACLFRAEEMEPDSWETQMNIACFFAMIGQGEVCLQKTIQAIEILKPLGGITKPMELLTTQRDNLTKVLAEAKQKKEAGAITSPAQTQQEGVKDEGKKEGNIELVGVAGA